MNTTQDVLNRFWSKVEVDGDCLVWSGSTSRGYGMFKIGPSKTGTAHRWIYQVIMGDLPPEIHLDHLCRKRNCVSVYHLEPVTPYENMMRGESFAATNARKTHCVRGHELSDSNIYMNHGSRCCRECDALAGKTYDARRRAAGNPRGRGKACRYGHEYTPDNTYLAAGGHRRQCRICRGKAL